MVSALVLLLSLLLVLRWLLSWLLKRLRLFLFRSCFGFLFWFSFGFPFFFHLFFIFNINIFSLVIIFLSPLWQGIKIEKTKQDKLFLFPPTKVFHTSVILFVFIDYHFFTPVSICYIQIYSKIINMEAKKYEKL